MVKELSIENIKKELMSAFLADMRVINSFLTKDVKKITEYIGKNIFDYIDEETSYCVDTYIHFDVSEDAGYKPHIVIKTHKDLLSGDGENKIDALGSVVKEIVTELFPYMTHYTNTPKHRCGGYIERHICFNLSEYDKGLYEGTEKPLF